MERPIYGPARDVARRRVAGGTVSTVYDDRDSGRTIISRWSDAEPALDMAKQIREDGPGTQAMRHAGVLPEDTFYALMDQAKQAVDRGEGDIKQVFDRLVRVYWQENPAFKT